MILKYQNYIAKVELQENGYLFGRVVNMKDQITFQTSDSTMLMEEFKNSVDDYLEFCKEEGDDPEKPFSGEIRYKTVPERHRQLSDWTYEEDRTMSEIMDDALDLYAEKKKRVA